MGPIVSSYRTQGRFVDIRKRLMREGSSHLAVPVTVGQIAVHQKPLPTRIFSSLPTVLLDVLYFS